MPHASSPDFTVLHTLRCIGVATEDRVASASGLGHDAAAHLRNLEERGLVELGRGPFGGWALTDQGRNADLEMVEAELDALGARDHVRDGYESFLTLNPILLEVCSDWQMRRVGNTPILNDHSDPDYDHRVLSRLMDVDDGAQEVCADLGRQLERFSGYAPRLTTALEKALAGHSEYVADDLESYHTVWFQLHEDLLVTLGISREDERG